MKPDDRKLAEIHVEFNRFGIDRAVVDFYRDGGLRYHYLRLSSTKFHFYPQGGIPETLEIE